MVIDATRVHGGMYADDTSLIYVYTGMLYAEGYYLYDKMMKQ
jgi:hypothetical protein